MLAFLCCTSMDGEHPVLTSSLLCCCCVVSGETDLGSALNVRGMTSLYPLFSCAQYGYVHTCICRGEGESSHQW